MGRRASLEIKMYPKKRRMTGLADKADMQGVYCVESLRSGIWYFAEGDEVVISTQDGFIFMNEEVAETIAKELTGILKDMKKFRAAGLKWAKIDAESVEANEA